jgi:hypothetical protein
MVDFIVFVDDAIAQTGARRNPVRERRLEDPEAGELG